MNPALITTVIYEEREFALLSDEIARGQILDASAVTGNPLTATLLAVSIMEPP